MDKKQAFFEITTHTRIFILFYSNSEQDMIAVL